VTHLPRRNLLGPLHEFHPAIDLLEQDTVPERYYQMILASQERRAREQGRAVR
jgi:hypothetical protein